MPRSHLHVEAGERTSKSHIRQFSQNWAGRGYFLAVTVSTFFCKNRHVWLMALHESVTSALDIKYTEYKD